MSEDHDTTPTGRDSTREGLFIPSHFNFSVSIGVDPKLVDAINNLADAIRGRQDPPVLRGLDPQEEKQTIADEPAIVHTPEEKLPVTQETVRKYEKSIKKAKRPRNQPKYDWVKVEGTKHLKYAEDGAVLRISYLSGTVRTTWAEMLKLAEHTGDAYRTARDKLKGSFKNPNQVTAVNQFVECIQNGVIVPPAEAELEGNFSAFQAEEDPDAAFRPMLNVNTRPDENCGKVEGEI